MGRHKCFGYLRVATTEQIGETQERGELHENLAQINSDEETSRRTGPLPGCMVFPDGSLLGVQRWLHRQQPPDPHTHWHN